MKPLPFALAPLALVLSGTLLAGQSSNALDEIIVSASRTSNQQTAQATVIITRDSIDRSTANNLPDLLRQVAGIQIRQLFGSGNAQATVDLGGFGPQAGQNSLILIDGQRQNDIDLSATDIGGISLDNIERIEIIKGSGGVLYGAGAVGGSINIITRNTVRNETIAKLGIGNHGAKEASLRHDFATNEVKGQAFFSHSQTDGYRDNNALRRIETGGKAQYDINPNNQLYVNLLANRQDSGLPGPRRVVRPGTTQFGTPINQLKDDPRGATSTTDYADTERYQALIGWRITNNVNTTSIIEGGYRLKQQEALVGSFVETNLGTLFFSPRVERTHQLGKVNGHLTLGIDMTRSDYDSNRQASKQSPTIHALDVSAKSTSIYAFETLQWNQTKLSMGARQSRNTINARDIYDPIADNPNGADDCLPDFSNFPSCFFPDGQAAPLNQTLKGDLYEVAISQALSNATDVGVGFSKSLRLPTVDDIFQGFGPESPFNSSFRAFTPLKAQTGKNITAFFDHRIGKSSIRLEGYEHRLKNELYFNSALFANENLGNTKRRGMNMTVSSEVTKNININTSYSYQQARFADGPNAGNDIPLVAKHLAQVSLNHTLSKQWQWGISSIYTGQRRFDNDESNTFSEQIPSMLRHDAKVVFKHGSITVTGSVRNLTNEKDHFEFGVRSGTDGIFNAFPLPGRELLISGEYRF